MGHSHVIARRIRRKSRKKGKNGPSENKYAHLVQKRNKFYDSSDKTFRELPISGEMNEVVRVGTKVIFHGRLYELLEDVIIPATNIVPGKKPNTMGRFRMVKEIG